MAADVAVAGRCADRWRGGALSKCCRVERGDPTPHLVVALAALAWLGWATCLAVQRFAADDRPVGTSGMTVAPESYLTVTAPSTSLITIVRRHLGRHRA